jgi:hypothetical protein
MKDKLSIIALIAIVGVASGLVGYTFSTSENVSPATSFATSALLSGHVELEVRDSEGNIKAYRQTDNVITTTGENCALRALFSPASIGSNAGTGVCVGALTEAFSFIELGTGSGTEQSTDITLFTPITSGTLAIAPASTITWTNSTTNTGATNAAKVVLSKTFTSDGSNTITEAGLFNGTSANTNGMFAHKLFTSVSIANNDQLTVEWTINIGNSTATGIGI